jgi:hypothetical protein
MKQAPYLTGCGVSKEEQAILDKVEAKAQGDGIDIKVSNVKLETDMESKIYLIFRGPVKLRFSKDRMMAVDQRDIKKLIEDPSILI